MAEFVLLREEAEHWLAVLAEELQEQPEGRSGVLKEPLEARAAEMPEARSVEQALPEVSDLSHRRELAAGRCPGRAGFYPHPGLGHRNGALGGGRPSDGKLPARGGIDGGVGDGGSLPPDRRAQSVG